MGSCVSKTKAARAKQGKVAAPLPPGVEKEGAPPQTSALPPPAVAVVEEEEVKEVVLSETPVPRPPRPPEPEPEPVKRRQQDQRHPGPGGQEAEDEAAASETCSASDSASAAKEVIARLQKAGGERREVEKRAVDAPEKGRTAAREDRDRERESKKAKAKGGCAAGTAGRARSPSPSAHRRPQHPPPAAQRREHPAVVSGIGCRSGRFSPSAARRAAESAAVRRTHSAREADMALPSSKRSSLARRDRDRDPGERSLRRSDSPTGRRAPASPISGAIHRPGTTSPMRNKAATPERGSRPPRSRDGADEQPTAAWAGGGEQQQKRLAAEDGAALGQNPSVAMECFIFL